MAKALSDRVAARRRCSSVRYPVAGTRAITIEMSRKHRRKIDAESRGRGERTAAGPRQFYAATWLALILLTTFVVYLPALNGAQLWDDEGHITKPALRSITGLYRT